MPTSAGRLERFRELSRHAGFRSGVHAMVLGTIGSAALALREHAPLPQVWYVLTCGCDADGHLVAERPVDFVGAIGNVVRVYPDVAVQTTLFLFLLLGSLGALDRSWSSWAARRPFATMLAVALSASALAALLGAWLVVSTLALFFP